VKPAPNSLHAGDCLETMRQWDDACIDHCITNPPYNMSKKNGLGWAFSSHVTMSEDWDIYPRAEYLDFTRAWLREVCRVVKPNGNIFIFGSYHNIYDIGSIIQDVNLKILNHVTWKSPTHSVISPRACSPRAPSISSGQSTTRKRKRRAGPSTIR
jgi:DNA modification methylase